MTQSPYLKPNRLADVIAAIQFMGMNERSSLPVEQWADGISGEKNRGEHWRRVFDEHAELFRKSPNYVGNYALIWRRAMPRLFYRDENRLLTNIEFKKLTGEQKKLVSRPPVPPDQIQTLIDVAIALHAKAHEQQRDWRWWVPIAASFAGSLLAVLLGIFLATSHDKQQPQQSFAPIAEESPG
jgi:hypothetical protein